MQSGQADLFAVALDHGEPAGMRHPLCRVGTGDLIAGGLGKGDRTVIAVGHLDTTVIALSRDDLAAWPVEKRAELIDRLLCQLAAATFGDLPAWPQFAAEPGHSSQLAAGNRLYAADGAVWVAPRSGTLSAGDGRLVLSGAIPIAAGLAVGAEEDAKVEVTATAAALEAGIDAAGLERFHMAILAALGGRIAEAEAAGRQRIAARGAADRDAMQGALRQLAEIGRRLPLQSHRAVSQDPEVAALAAVAADQGIEPSRIPRIAARSGSPLAAAARANGIGLREVLLREAWWRFDNGPLLAWQGEERRPVALLPAGRRAYRLWDPADGSSVAVDAAVAAEIAPQAVMTYRPMPLRIPNVAALAGFASRGMGSELKSIFVAALLSAAIAALLPTATGFLFESAVPRAESGQVLMVIGGRTLAALGAGMFDLTISIALLRLEGRLETAMQPALMNRLLALPVNFFRGFGAGELNNRVLAIQGMRQLFGSQVLGALLSTLFAISSFVVMLVYSPFLAVVAAGLVLAAAAVSAALAVGELRQQRVRAVLRGQEEGLVLQAIQGIAKLRVAASEARIFGLWAALFARQKQRFLKGQIYAGFAGIFGEVYPILAVLAFFLAASPLLMTTETAGPVLGLGAFLAVNAAFGQLFGATTAMARSVTTMLEAVPLFERLRPIIAAEPEANPDKSEAGRSPVISR